jgi:hypothetical protein
MKDTLHGFTIQRHQTQFTNSQTHQLLHRRPEALYPDPQTLYRNMADGFSRGYDGWSMMLAIHHHLVQKPIPLIISAVRWPYFTVRHNYLYFISCSVVGLCL